MHDDSPSQPGPEYQPPAVSPAPAPAPAPAPPAARSWRRGAGGAALTIGLLAAKFKTILAVLLSLKWLLLGGKFLLSFGSIFVSIVVYAQVFGWKLGVVFVLLILVHEMGHWVVLRGFGVPVSLPYFIPGLGAFVAQKQATGGNVEDAAAALAGPIVGIAAAAICQAYGIATGNAFWVVAAHIGYLLNLFNLIPVLPLDGGRAAGAIEPRLWLLGLVLFGAYIVWAGLNHPIAWVFLILIGISSVPRAIAAWRGYVEPRVLATPPATRGLIALAYFATIAVAALGAARTNIHV